MTLYSKQQEVVLMSMNLGCDLLMSVIVDVSELSVVPQAVLRQPNPPPHSAAPSQVLGGSFILETHLVEDAPYRSAEGFCLGGCDSQLLPHSTLALLCIFCQEKHLISCDFRMWR